MDVRKFIFDQMQQVATEQNIKLAPLTDDLVLLESGLTSLCVAILVAKLEDELNVDPFGSGDDTTMPLTVGDFVRLYEDAVVISAN
jgi:hypothetical protein